MTDFDTAYAAMVFSVGFTSPILFFWLGIVISRVMRSAGLNL